MLECGGLCVFPRLPHIEFRNARTFLEERPPIVRSPGVRIGFEVSDYICLVTSQCLQHGGDGLTIRVKNQIGARYDDVNTTVVCKAKSISRPHMRALQR